jgi:hypothetical protein
MYSLYSLMFFLGSDYHYVLTVRFNVIPALKDNFPNPTTFDDGA